MSTLSPQVTPYYGGGQVVNPSNVIQTSGPPPSAFTEDKLGSLAVDNAAHIVYGLASKVGGVNSWVVLGGPTVAVQSLSGNTGGDIFPISGDINVVGVDALTFVGSGNSLTGIITPGAFLVSKLAAGSGGSLSPVAGLINILGTTNEVSTVGATNTITLSIPSTFITPGSIEATTSITADFGAITAINGDIVLTAPGNKMIRRSFATTSSAGADSIGSVVLVGGTITVLTSSVTPSSLIQIWRQSIGATGAAALGYLSVGTIDPGVSFIINAVTPASAVALQTTDVSVVGWEIIN